jgi:NADH dehydrogenase FAD-containing subunit
MAEQPHVVVIAAGYGGLRAAGALARGPVCVTVLDRHHCHLFLPLLYQVATAGLSPGGAPRPRAQGHPRREGAPDPTPQVRGHPGVFAIGDLACLETDGRPLPIAAPVAMQQGVVAARNAMHQLRGEPLEAFCYRDPGQLATIGRNAAVAHVKGLSFKGFPAWVVWLVVHLIQLIGFRNRLAVLISWAWEYFLYDRAVRLITSPPRVYPGAGSHP